MGSKLIALKNEVPRNPWFPLNVPPAQNPTGLLHPVVMSAECSSAKTDLHSNPAVFGLSPSSAKVVGTTIAIDSNTHSTLDFKLRDSMKFSSFLISLFPDESGLAFGQLPQRRLIENRTEVLKGF
jgi:hypothetical protein